MVEEIILKAEDTAYLIYDEQTLGYKPEATVDESKFANNVYQVKLEALHNINTINPDKRTRFLVKFSGDNPIRPGKFSIPANQLFSKEWEAYKETGCRLRVAGFKLLDKGDEYLRKASELRGDEGYWY